MTIDRPQDPLRQYSRPTAPYLHQNTSVTWVMAQVLLALMPAFVLYVSAFGWGVIIHLALASVTALACEAAMLTLRKRPLAPFLTDGSALVTAALLTLAIPPLAPWWITVIAIFFAMVFAKHLYGGLGYNPFNPAMVGYAVLLISFTKELTIWPSPAHMTPHVLNLAETWRLIFSGELPPSMGLDALSSATPLDAVKTQLSQFIPLSEIRMHQMFSSLDQPGWMRVNLAILAGGLWLLWQRIITWHIPVSVLGGLFTISFIFHVLDPNIYPSPWFHLFSGAAMLCAFFIATDPVSAATSRRGKLFFGAGIGLLIYVIRTWGGYPDGVAFAVLVMNMAAPMLDYYTQPRVFGYKR